MNALPLRPARKRVSGLEKRRGETMKAPCRVLRGSSQARVLAPVTPSVLKECTESVAGALVAEQRRGEEGVADDSCAEQNFEQGFHARMGEMQLYIARRPDVI